MAHDAYALDASALLTFIEGEDGAGRVEAILRSGRALIPWVAVLEVTYVTRQERSQKEADRRYALLTQLPARLLWVVDEAILLSAAALKADHRLSLADALTAAHARACGAVLVHKDPEYESLRGLVELEALPYKRP